MLERRFASIGLVLTIFVSMIAVTCFATTIKAQPSPIYLYSDYTLTSNHDFDGDGFIIAADGIKLDLNGYNITGSGTGTGILNEGYDNVWIMNSELVETSWLQNFATGISITQNAWNCSVGYRTERAIVVGRKVIDNNDEGIHVEYDLPREWPYSPSVASTTLQNNQIGLYLEGNMSYVSCKIFDNDCGVYAEGGGLSRVSFLWNIVDRNTVGMRFYNYACAFLLASRVRYNTDVGVVLNSSKVGAPWESGIGVFEWYNTIKENPIGLKLLYSNDNIICNWDFINNTVGVRLENSNNNQFYHNNFINNTNHVELQNSIDNAWNSTYPIGGNYWHDYTDVDSYSGPDQNVPGSDGIWDNPYIIDGNNQDNYPLTNKYFPSDINYDGIVDIFDLVKVARCYGCSELFPECWIDCRYADINVDGVVDIFDLVTVAIHYGEEITDC